MSSVSISKLAKSYGAVEVIHGVDAEIDDGEFVILVGPSGCGKSTLLRMIAGLESSSSGLIRIGERIVNHVPPKDRDIAMVFQSYALYPHMSVGENLGFSLRLRNEKKDVIASKVREAADILGLTPYLERKPRQLSGGQRQRVAMGRAIVRDPKVFLFDEPLSNLDAKLRVQMRTEIKALHQRIGTTTIYVTHDQVEAMTMADRIVVMRDGHIEQVGAPLELYDHPVNRFVAGFIGSPAMNFLDGKVDATGFTTVSGVHFDLTGDLMAPGQPTVLGIRPEHIVRAPGGFRAEVLVTEPTGSEVLIIARIVEGANSQTIECLLRERFIPAVGEIIEIGADPELLHLFDAETGNRLGQP